MPELPDVEVYVEALRERLLGRRLLAVRLASPFILRSVTPPPADAEGRAVRSIRRLGKRVVIGLEDDLFLVIHLMIAGRFRWLPRGAAAGGRPPVPKKIGLAAFDFEDGTLVLTEAGSRKRASLHLARGEEGLAPFARGGLEPQAATPEAFREALTRESHTLKRALTDPRLFSGIGNAYSDEILHRARLSPLTLSGRLDPAEIARLHAATRVVLEEWTGRLRRERGQGFPEKVTAFREGMAVHGRHGKPCPACGTAVQRIVYAENECDYCPRCQTGGKLLADRLLSRLLKDDWPRTIEELEGGAEPGRGPAAGG